MKKKQFDAFSFKAPQQSEQSIGDISSKEEIPPSIQIPKEIIYRHLQSKPPTIVYDRQINKKISTINEQIDINVKRRMELQQKLSTLQKLDREKKQRQMFATYSANKYKHEEQISANFSKMNLEADKIDRIITEQPKSKSKNRLDKNRGILLGFNENMESKERILIPIIQHMSNKKSKPIPVYTVPDQAKLQGYLRKITFPQIPSGNLTQLKKQLEQLAALYSPHSDLHYLLMAICFHLKNWQGVRKHYSEICNFKTYNLKSHWIAAQTEFEEKNYDLCLKLSEQCINLVAEQFLPRFVYLKARCYEGIGNYVNSLVCFNQLIRMRPNISDYYLERGILYHRLGYYPQAKEDFVTFGVMRPEAQMILKEKILAEKSEHKKKQYIAVLAKMF